MQYYFVWCGAQNYFSQYVVTIKYTKKHEMIIKVNTFIHAL